MARMSLRSSAAEKSRSEARGSRDASIAMPSSVIGTSVMRERSRFKEHRVEHRKIELLFSVELQTLARGIDEQGLLDAPKPGAAAQSQHRRPRQDSTSYGGIRRSAAARTGDGGTRRRLNHAARIT